MTSARLVALLLAALIGLIACTQASTPAPSGTLTLVLTAGPVCPVVRDPPDPACAPRPVENQVVALLAADREVARGTSDANGRIDFSLPVGRYTVHPVMGDSPFPAPPADQTVDVGPGLNELLLEFDTGIR